jgi:sugar lactone lactonase YvrE
MARSLLIFVFVATVCATAAGTAAAPVRLLLPYDLQASGSSLYIADGERHQILRYDLVRSSLTVVAGTGATGTSGDGRPAVKARLTEPTELVVDRAGNLYFSDVNQGRVRRIDRKGIITTVARVHAAAGLAIDPSGRNVAIASIEGYIFRMPLPSGPLERLAGNGTATVSGDGGPATQATLNGPHDVTYDAAGNLYIGGYGHVRRIDVATGIIDTAFAHDAFKVVAARDGTFYLLTGGPHGGRVTQVDAVGNVLRTIGSGRLSPHRASARIDRVGFLPSDVEPVAGAILVSETEPVPAIRRLAAGSSTLTTLVR